MKPDLIICSPAALQREGRTGPESNASRPKGWCLTCKREIGHAVICFPDLMAESQGLKSTTAWSRIILFITPSCRNPNIACGLLFAKQQQHLLTPQRSSTNTFIHSHAADGDSKYEQHNHMTEASHWIRCYIHESFWVWICSNNLVFTSSLNGQLFWEVDKNKINHCIWKCQLYLSAIQRTVLYWVINMLWMHKPS